MNVQLLIDSIVRQVTVLIAQLATSGGLRAPLAHIANQVFFEIAQELSAQGISRKVSADMFGMALRAYIRKLRRLSEGKTEQGQTLWQAILEFIRLQPMVSRTRLLERFQRDGDVEVSAIVHDLLDSGLVFSSGTGQHTVYRAVNDEELLQLSKLSSGEGLDELVWVTIFRSGPIDEEQLASLLFKPKATLSEAVSRLEAAGRVQKLTNGQLHAQDFLIPLGSSVGWEAAVFDHIQAVVKTICQRLASPAIGEVRDWVGGSTYTFDIWAGHPLEAAVKAQLSDMRQRCGQLRQQVSDYNQLHGLKDTFEQVTTYVGQCGVEQQLPTTNESCDTPNASERTASHRASQYIPTNSAGVDPSNRLR